MAQRAISEQEVEATLADYHTRYSDPRGGDGRIGDPNGRRIKIVVMEGSQPPHIITVAD